LFSSRSRKTSISRRFSPCCRRGAPENLGVVEHHTSPFDEIIENILEGTVLNLASGAVSPPSGGFRRGCGLVAGQPVLGEFKFELMQFHRHRAVFGGIYGNLGRQKYGFFLIVSILCRLSREVVCLVSLTFGNFPASFRLLTPGTNPLKNDKGGVKNSPPISSFFIPCY
jgi:hypothetical protein